MKTLFKCTVPTIIIISGLSGCVSPNAELEGISPSGGNAIAHNSALQIVHPWPEQVHDTDLVTPTNRNQNQADAPTSTGASAPSSPSASPVVALSTPTPIDD